MKTFDGAPRPDDAWYHAGHPITDEEILERQAHGLPAYNPTDPRATDQTPYIEFASKDRTPQIQQESAK